MKSGKYFHSILLLALLLGVWELWPEGRSAEKVRPISARVRDNRQKDIEDFKGVTLGSVEKLRQNLQQVLKTLPTVDDVAKLSDEEVHSTPQILLEAAARLGAATDEISGHPEYKTIALEFYSSCAQQAKGLLPIRSVCYKHANEIYHEIYGKLSKFHLDHKISSEVDN